MDRVTFNVSGQHLTIARGLLNAGPESKIKDLSKSKDDVIVVDRPPDVFASFLSMYQTGELHMPKTCCPGTFLLELEYWNILPEKLATCCYFKLQRFTNEQKNLNKFKKSLTDAMEKTRRGPVGTFPFLTMMRNRLWSIVDFGDKSPIATIYFAISLIMVLVSICNLAFNTDPSFRRNMTNCERYEFMEKFDMDDLELVEDWLKADCGNSTDSGNKTSSTGVTPAPLQLGEDDYEFINIKVKASPNDAYCIPFRNMSFAQLRRLNQSVVDHCLPERLKGGLPPTVFVLKKIKIPNFKLPIEVFRVMELVTTIYFTTDIILRLISCPSVLYYFMSIVNIADAIALIGAYTNWLLVLYRPREQYEVNWLDLLEYLQMLRSLRLFRLVMSFNISKVLVYSVEQSLKDGFIMVLFLLSGMCTFSTCLYLSEDKNIVRTIPDAWYWSVITMTTVGYGDIVPKTTVGRFVACLCSVCGVLVFALTVPLFVNQFITLYQYADMDMAEEVEAMKEESPATFPVRLDRQHAKRLKRDATTFSMKRSMKITSA